VFVFVVFDVERATNFLNIVFKQVPARFSERDFLFKHFQKGLFFGQKEVFHHDQPNSSLVRSRSRHSLPQQQAYDF
jgi:hypothetical protein